MTHMPAAVEKLNDTSLRAETQRGFGLRLTDHLKVGGQPLGLKIRQKYLGCVEPVYAPHPVSIEEFERDMRE